MTGSGKETAVISTSTADSRFLTKRKRSRRGDSRNPGRRTSRATSRLPRAVGSEQVKYSGLCIRNISVLLLLESLILLYFISTKPQAAVLLFFGVINFLALGGAGVTELLRSRGVPRPIAPYLLAGALRLGAGPCHIAACIWFGFKNSIRFGPTAVQDHLMAAFALFVFGDALLIGAFWLWTRHSTRLSNRPSPKRTRFVYNRAILTTTTRSLLAAGWGLSILTYIGFQGLRASSVLATLTTALPSSAALLMFASARSMRAGRTAALQTAWFVTAINIGFGMQSAAKTSTLIALMPGLMHLLGSLWERQRKGTLRVRLRPVIAGSVICWLVVLFVFPFVQRLRYYELSTRGNFQDLNRFEISTDVLAASIPGTAEFHKVHRFPNHGMWSFTARQMNVLAVAFSMQYVDEHANFAGRFFKDGLRSTIPRVFWQGKPIYAPGKIIAKLAGHSKKNQTQLDAGDMVGGLYLDLGMRGAFFGMVTTGLLLAIMWKRFGQDACTNPASAVAMMLMYIWTFKHFENGIDWNVQGWTLLVALVFAQKIWETFVGFHPKDVA